MSSSPSRPELTTAIEDYAKAIYALRPGGGGRPVTTNELAERLGVTPASASGMVRRLAELGLAEHEPYRGVALTDAGTRVALEVIRHHRLLETYLTESLGLPWDRVHAEAEVLEHVLSEDLEAAISEQLGDPTHDPHGAPIPTADLQIDERPTRPLASLEPGDRARLVSVSDRRPEMLRWLSERGIAPGAELVVVDKQPFGGPLFVRFGADEQVLGGEVAVAMRVEDAT